MSKNSSVVLMFTRVSHRNILDQTGRKLEKYYLFFSFKRPFEMPTTCNNLGLPITERGLQTRRRLLFLMIIAT